MVQASPLRACEQLTNEDEIAGTIAIIERGDCMFIEKVSKVTALLLSLCYVISGCCLTV